MQTLSHSLIIRQTLNCSHTCSNTVRLNGERRLLFALLKINCHTTANNHYITATNKLTANKRTNYRQSENAAITTAATCLYSDERGSTWMARGLPSPRKSADVVDWLGLTVPFPVRKVVFSVLETVEMLLFGLLFLRPLSSWQSTGWERSNEKSGESD